MVAFIAARIRLALGSAASWLCPSAAKRRPEEGGPTEPAWPFHTERVLENSRNKKTLETKKA